MLTSKWESLNEIRLRTGKTPKEVIEETRELFKSGQAHMKFEEANGIKTTFWRKKGDQ